ncbi:hypothetical protein DV735_g4419, partial [Chaetothyriales sp. CBS 134920]
MNPTKTTNLPTVIFHGLNGHTTRLALRGSVTLIQPWQRSFSATRRAQLELHEPTRNLPNTQLTQPQFPHPSVTEAQLKNISIAHRDVRTWGDWTAYNTVRFFRWATDLATGYQHDSAKPYVMNEKKWLIRFIFLETVAGVPGMMAGMIRHFHSLRRMKRDNGWIETLLEDAYNERMHLLTFLKMAEPGWFMRMMILGAQGVFSNGFFLAYLISPKICHRFVGYLEEEATKTYTLAIQDLESGKLPQWEKLEAPEIAINYWHMPEGKRSMLDLLYYIRADEAKHREIHHTLGNLDQKKDPNPFASEYKDQSKPHPTRGIDHLRATGWEKEELI